MLALSALLELVRGQQTGTFSQAQFASTATILLGSKAVGDDTLEAFTSRYLAFADVRSAVLMHVAPLTHALATQQACHFFSEVCLHQVNSMLLAHFNL